MGHKIDELHDRVVMARWKFADWAYDVLPHSVSGFCMPVMYWAIKEVNRETREEMSRGAVYDAEILVYQRKRERQFWECMLRNI